MNKVFQTIVKQGSGDCARAAMASLFETELDEMPRFFPDQKQSWEIMKYFQSKGYDPTYYNGRYNGKVVTPPIEEIAKYDGGINGYFYASVPSQTFEGGSHAVIVDIELNIVHDPNPNQLALKLKPEDVVDIIVVGSWEIDLDGNIVDNKKEEDE